MVFILLNILGQPDFFKRWGESRREKAKEREKAWVAEIDERIRGREEYEVLKSEIPIVSDLDLVNYCANRGQDPKMFRLEKTEWVNREIEKSDAQRREELYLREQERNHYLARTHAKKVGGIAILYPREEVEEVEGFFDKRYSFTGQILIPVKPKSSQ
ncbi:hypothetical protein KA107_01205 [Candidatus Pacearchaeota archaeon]|nr:hypothetical protein [Candidatus Pacearchaeota archaeon]